ncbi:MAG: hypothetical protein HYX48_03440 [Chlamydiales bacterium]|nr:hypothetical protein [Chlamydiales bacterium]
MSSAASSVRGLGSSSSSETDAVVIDLQTGTRGAGAASGRDSLRLNRTDGSGYFIAHGKRFKVTFFMNNLDLPFNSAELQGLIAGIKKTVEATGADEVARSSAFQFNFFRTLKENEDAPSPFEFKGITRKLQNEAIYNDMVIGNGSALHNEVIQLNSTMTKTHNAYLARHAAPALPALAPPTNTQRTAAQAASRARRERLEQRSLARRRPVGSSVDSKRNTRTDASARSDGSQPTTPRRQQVDVPQAFSHESGMGAGLDAYTYTPSAASFSQG